LLRGARQVTVWVNLTRPQSGSRQRSSSWNFAPAGFGGTGTGVGFGAGVGVAAGTGVATTVVGPGVKLASEEVAFGVATATGLDDVGAAPALHAAMTALRTAPSAACLPDMTAALRYPDAPGWTCDPGRMLRPRYCGTLLSLISRRQRASSG
jgi:hypothetical protein